MLKNVWDSFYNNRVYGYWVYSKLYKEGKYYFNYAETFEGIRGNEEINNYDGRYSIIANEAGW